MSSNYQQLIDQQINKVDNHLKQSNIYRKMINLYSNLTCYLTFDYSFEEDISKNSRFDIELKKYNPSVLEISKKRYKQSSVKTNTIFRNFFSMRLKVDNTYLLNNEEIIFEIFQKNLSSYFRKKQQYVVSVSQIFSNMMDEDISIHKVQAFQREEHQELQAVVISTKKNSINQEQIMSYLRNKEFYLLQKQSSFKLSMSEQQSKCQILSTVSSQGKKFKRSNRTNTLQTQIKSPKRERFNISMSDKDSCIDTQTQEDYIKKIPKSLRRSLLTANHHKEDTYEAENLELLKKKIYKILHPSLISFQVALMVYLMFPSPRV